MEKFAVDLEKVLNDFEYSEEQLNEYPPEERSINNPYSCNYKVCSRYFRPPASNYRRQPFEPVNLADADFSVSPRPSSTQIQPNYIISDFKNKSSEFAYEQPILSIDSNKLEKNEEFLLPNYSLPKNREYKPDLIESNADVFSSVTECNRFERHLPDVASANVEAKDENVNFDLIHDSVDREVNNEEPSKEIIRFPTVSDVSENELHQYLDELEESIVDEPFDTHFLAPENAIEAPETTSCSEVTCNENNKISITIEADQSNKIETQCEDFETQENNQQNNVAEEVFVISENGTTSVEVQDIENVREYVLNETEGSAVDVVDGVEITNVDDECKNNSTEKLSCPRISIEETQLDDDEVKECSNVGTSDDEELIANSNEYNLSSDDSSTCLQGENYSNNVEPFTDSNPVHSEEPVRKEKSLNEKKTDEVLVNESHVKIEERTETPHVSSIVCTQDDSLQPSETNYQILDSKTAISTFEIGENSSGTLTAENSDYGAGEPVENTCDQPKLQRPDSLNLVHTTQNSEMSSTSADSGSLLSAEERKLGREQPFWIPDSETSVCMQCQMKFTLVRRRHHCRACGLVLCSKCCDMKAKIEYLGFEEARVCHNCYSTLERINNLEAEISSLKRPNPNNPMEYCSTIPPLLQVGPTQPTPPSVLVPVTGVLKREGRAKTNDTPKQVIFSDGIRPGGDLTELDCPSESRLSLRRHTRVTKRVGTPPGGVATHRRMLNPETRSFIPSNHELPPLMKKMQGEYIFSELEKVLNVDDEAVKFAINRNLFVNVKRIVLDCCVNRDVWCMTTDGLSCVGQDEVVFILEVLPDEKYPPKDVFSTINMLYQEASKGTTVTEMSFASPCLNQLFSSKDHGGFVFIRPTYQCIQKLLLPKPPYLIALLIHRWETPWARLFPIRLVLRLGAEYRYYPCPLVSIRNREALFTDIGHTIISLLADFRKYSYSLPTVRGLMIHMEDRLTTILLPKNRYDQVIRAMNNSEENVLAFAGNISTLADSHLVCIQSTQDDTSYTTQAINIHNKPRQVTGASFIVFNGSLKNCSWAGKSNIVEDGLMVQILSESMVKLRTALKQMKDYSIGCGPQAEEVVMLKWSADDINFNIGVKSNINNRPLDGVPSIRVHNGTDYSGSSRLIRWTEVFILQSDEDCDNKTGDTVNISKLSESIARATCIALVPLLDLLATANLTTLAVRATIHPENVGYEAGSNGEKLPPLYMKSLDETLIAVVHEAAVAIRDISYPIILELIFKIMEQG